MPNVDLTEMDLALIRCLHGLSADDKRGVHASQLVSCLQQRFPRYDEVSMREGESITRLRGRQLVAVHDQGRLTLTSLGIELAEGLALEEDGEATSASGS
jgi:hypothetical protein